MCIEKEHDGLQLGTHLIVRKRIKEVMQTRVRFWMQGNETEKIKNSRSHPGPSTSSDGAPARQSYGQRRGPVVTPMARTGPPMMAPEKARYPRGIHTQYTKTERCVCLFVCLSPFSSQTAGRILIKIGMDLPLDPRDVLHILFGGYPHQGGVLIFEKLKIVGTFPYCFE